MWRAPDPRPLYNLPAITQSSLVVLVEGEKCADALILRHSGDHRDERREGADRQDRLASPGSALRADLARSRFARLGLHRERGTRLCRGRLCFRFDPGAAHRTSPTSGTLPMLLPRDSTAPSSLRRANDGWSRPRRRCCRPLPLACGVDDDSPLT